ncbi:MAG TPA: thiol:disulfide interchange protein DsbA/DsbL [Burkholderiales bacterium]|nr:thiol:disulfide interchange protein DsbA/DsbL [Burkholderiales bacterium]
MRLLRAFAIYCLSTILLAASAYAQQPVADKEYKLVQPPQPTQDPKKIEVLEFFSYACPHCADFEPYLQDWLKRQSKDVEFRAVPMVFRDSWRPLAKLYYTMEAMGTLEKNHQKVFDAIHKQGQALFTDQAVIDWASKQGMDKAKFEQTYNSMGIENKVQRAIAMGRAYGIQFTPAMAVNGKYWTGPSMVAAGGAGPDMNRFFGVLDYLINRERAAHTPASPQQKRK